MAPTVVLEIEGYHKDYLTIFSQTMNLMLNIFPPSKRCHQLAVTAMIDSCNSSSSTIKSQTFFFWPKNKRPLTLSKIFPYLLSFLWTSSNLVTCLALYKKDQATHQGEPLSDPLILKLHLAATYSFSHFSIFLTKSLFIDNNITHILQHHYPLPIFLTLHYSEVSSFCCPKTHLHLILYFSYKISLLRKQHNPWHNTKNHSSNSYNLIPLLHLTFISSISHFHIFCKHISHKIPINTSHISLNTMSH